MEAQFNEKVHIMNHPLVAHKLTTSCAMKTPASRIFASSYPRSVCSSPMRPCATFR